MPIRLVSYNNPELDFGAVVPHGSAEVVEEDLGGRWPSLAADDEGLVGVVSPHETSQGAWTRHPGLVMIIRELIIHDLCLYEVMEACGQGLVERFGPHGISLREEYRHVRQRTVLSLSTERKE